MSLIIICSLHTHATLSHDLLQIISYAGSSPVVQPLPLPLEARPLKNLFLRCAVFANVFSGLLDTYSVFAFGYFICILNQCN